MAQSPIEGTGFCFGLIEVGSAEETTDLYHLVCFEKLFVNDSLQGRGEH